MVVALDKRLTPFRLSRPGSGEAFNVARFLEEVNPYMWAMTGIGLAVGLSVLGAGWSVQFAALGTDLRLKTRDYAGASSSLELQFLEVVYGHPESERRTLLGTPWGH